MCTVTYIPKNNTDYILTSNRDESINRAKALSPEIEAVGNVNVLFPKDALKGGTWIGVTDQNRTLCLLNGAFEKHINTNDYIKSRGLVVLDFFKAEPIVSFIQSYSLKGIEPFTLIIIDGNDSLFLTELKWDGLQKHVTKLNSSESHIWSSATLYNAEQASYKSKRFYEHINEETDAEDILKYHELGTKTEPQLMRYINESSPIETISITQIKHLKNKASINYYSLIDNTNQNKEIEFNSMAVI